MVQKNSLIEIQTQIGNVNLNKKDCAKEGERAGGTQFPTGPVIKCCTGLELNVPENTEGGGGICRKIINDTSDWQTYRNEKYGFEFQYPKDWKIKISTDAVDKHSFEANSILVPSGHYVGFGVVENNEDLNILAFWKKEYGWIGEQGTSFRNYQEENISGAEAARYIPVNDLDGTVGNIGFWIKLKDNNFFAIDSFNLTKDEETNLNKVIFTFKFIN